MTATTIDQFTNFVQRKSSEAEEGRGFLWAIVFTWDLFRLQYKSKRAIRLTREMMQECDVHCPEASCMEKRYERSAFVRDQLLIMNERLVKKGFPKSITNPFEEMLDDWDELATDCALSADSEIRELFSSISAKL